MRHSCFGLAPLGHTANSQPMFQKSRGKTSRNLTTKVGSPIQSTSTSKLGQGDNSRRPSEASKELPADLRSGMLDSKLRKFRSQCVSREKERKSVDSRRVPETKRGNTLDLRKDAQNGGRLKKVWLEAVQTEVVAPATRRADRSVKVGIALTEKSGQKKQSSRVLSEGKPELKINGLRKLAEGLTLELRNRSPGLSQGRKGYEPLEWDDAKAPYDCRFVLQHFCHLLSAHEREEVREYKKLWYLGHKAEKRLGSPRTSFDTEEYAGGRSSDYVVTPHDHIAYRYELLDVLGRGSYGQVVKCFDHKTKEPVALKIVRSKDKFSKQAFVEVRILTYLRENEASARANVVAIKDFVIFRHHVCIVFELLAHNLYELIETSNFVGLPMPFVRKVAIQLLQTLVFLRKHRIIHADLKPENILLCEQSHSRLRVIDFGSSCFDTEIIYTYIQSRYYRAPEVTLGAPYGLGIDTWSTACILAELATGAPLFPGENEREQMKYLVSTLGPPPVPFLRTGLRAPLFFAETGALKAELGSLKVIEHFTKPLSQRIGDELFVEFLGSMLRWEASKRALPHDLLEHAWVLSGFEETSLARTRSKQASAKKMERVRGQSERRKDASSKRLGKMSQ